MATAVGVGISRSLSSEQAGREAVARASEAAGTDRPDFVLLYATVRHDPGALVRGASVAAGGARLAGCSAQGVSALGESRERGAAVAALALRSDDLGITVDLRTGVGAASEAVAREAATVASREGTPSLVLSHWDPLTGLDANGLVRGYADLGTPNVLGGAASQFWGRPSRTWQIAGDRVVDDGLLTIAMHGGQALVETSHGAEPLGLTLEVTRCEGNLLLELDGKPALDVWNEMTGNDGSLQSDAVGSWLLGEETPDLPAHYGGILTRAVFGVAPERRAVILQAAIAQGVRVQVCRRTRPAVREGARKLAERLRAALDGRVPQLAIAAECGGRTAPFLGEEETLEECADVRSILGPVPWIGMYAWGELAPVHGRLLFHQLTFPVAVVV